MILALKRVPEWVSQAVIWPVLRQAASATLKNPKMTTFRVSPACAIIRG